MKTFRVTGAVVGSKYLGEIEAETAQEALARAPEELAFDVDLCHHCADQCEDPEIDKYIVEEAGGNDSAQVDGFWEGQYYKAQARVLELEKRLEQLRNDALEEAALAVEAQTVEPVDTWDRAWSPWNQSIANAARCIRNLKREAK